MLDHFHHHLVDARECLRRARQSRRLSTDSYYARFWLDQSLASHAIAREWLCAARSIQA